MLFSSTVFLFYFLPLVFAAYYVIKNRDWRNGVLLFFSLLFYAWSGLQGFLVILVSIGFNWVIALFVDKHRERRFVKLLLFVMVAVNLLIIGYFKYSSFVVNNFAHLFGLPDVMEKVFMPVGISFFTFQAMSYVLDVYRGKGVLRKNIFDVALYISLFPQLVAGPIIRYETVSDAISGRVETLSEFSKGVRRFIYGLSKKLLLANAVGLIASDIFAFETQYLSAAGAWVGAIAYTLQIYLDFSAYSDMAIGLGMMFGFHFLENFDYPYISKSITEFWRRWHISLGTWFRDYLYIPLGGNRVSVGRHIFNIAVVWLLTGLWHGAEWTFIAWGAYYGILLIIEKYFFGRILEKLPVILRHVIVMVLVIFGWVLFRADTIEQALNFIKVMFGFGQGGAINDQAIFYIAEYPIIWIACILASAPLKLPIKRLFAYLGERTGDMAAAVWEVAIFALSVIELLNTTFNPFIYFRF